MIKFYLFVADDFAAWKYFLYILFVFFVGVKTFSVTTIVNRCILFYFQPHRVE